MLSFSRGIQFRTYRAFISIGRQSAFRFRPDIPRRLVNSPNGSTNSLDRCRNAKQELLRASQAQRLLIAVDAKIPIPCRDRNDPGNEASTRPCLNLLPGASTLRAAAGVRLSFVSESAHVLRLEPHRIFKFAIVTASIQMQAPVVVVARDVDTAFPIFPRLPLNKGRQAIFYHRICLWRELCQRTLI